MSKTQPHVRYYHPPPPVRVHRRLGGFPDPRCIARNYQKKRKKEKTRLVVSLSRATSVAEGRNPP